MDHKGAVIADTLERLMMNQIALRAVLEKVSLWVSQRGSTHIPDNVLSVLKHLIRTQKASPLG
ncbi:hypothetical protein D3C76_459170 [compost metagenome]